MLLSFVVVIAGAAVLSAVILGYSFNFKGEDGHVQVERLGILQVDSRPNGATVFINDRRHSTNTRARLTPTEGEYSLRIEKQNYRTWQKQVYIKGGELTWVAYPRLIPSTLTPESVADLPDTLADALPSGSSRRYALLESATSPSVRVAMIDREKPEFKTATIPSSVYNNADGGTFKLHLWSGNERFVILKHIREGKPIEWLVLNIDKPSESLNINRMFGIDEIEEVVFGDSGGGQLYALADGKVRHFDIGSKTISSPLVSDVNNFRLYGDGYILFVTDDESSKTRQFGYTRKNFKQPKVVRTIPLDKTKKAFIDIDKYYDRFYFLTSNGNEAQLDGSSKLYSLPSSPDDEVNLTNITKLSTKDDIIHLNIADNGQLATVQDGKSFATYNLESTQQHTTEIKPSATGEPQKLRYLDTYLFWGDNNGTLRTYEFDGANQNDIMPIIAKFDATISPSGKYLYGVAKTADGKYQFKRVQLLDI